MASDVSRSPAVSMNRNRIPSVTTVSSMLVAGGSLISLTSAFFIAQKKVE